ncbi:hypothetical protein Rhal01_03727 [Rubritalea halochordaticola]|uniref:Uncharacterized protein n=1 Tax=Rubritalea halochordaticola TaxID=714537 RepID=A0ABP9V4E5_9BACT
MTSALWALYPKGVPDLSPVVASRRIATPGISPTQHTTPTRVAETPSCWNQSSVITNQSFPAGAMTSVLLTHYPGGVTELSAGSATNGSATPGTGPSPITTPEGWRNLTHLAELSPLSFLLPAGAPPYPARNPSSALTPWLRSFLIYNGFVMGKLT